MARRTPLAWVRRHPFGFDVLLAVSLAALSLPQLWGPADTGDYRDANALAVVLVLVQTLPLVLRRRWPIGVLATTGFTATINEAAGFRPTGASAAVIIAFYTVAAYMERRRMVESAAITFACLLIAFQVSRQDATLADFIGNVAVFTAAWVLGDNMRTRRIRTAELEERATFLERDREERARRAVEDERTRIARELHDVVAHSVSVMTVQAGAARRVVRASPDQAEEALRSIESTGRAALGEMRRLLGVLRGDEDSPSPLAPQPGVADVDALVTQLRDTGMPVELQVEGEPRPLASGVDLSAYRIVQEALTNTMKHAGPARAWVRLCYGPDVLELRVIDDGRGAANRLGQQNGDGHGLVGMRERVTLYGGELHVGPRPGGGFEVRARLPVDTAVRHS